MRDLVDVHYPGGGNAARVYRALASFGAPLSSFEVSETDFVTYDGVLQIGLPPQARCISFEKHFRKLTDSA